MFKECNRYRRRGLPRCRVRCRVRNNGVQEFSTYLKYSTKGAEISRSPPTYRVRRGEGSIQGGEGRITTPCFGHGHSFSNFGGKVEKMAKSYLRSSDLLSKAVVKRRWHWRTLQAIQRICSRFSLEGLRNLG